MISPDRATQRGRTLDYAHRSAASIGDTTESCSPESTADITAWAGGQLTTEEVLRRVDARVLVGADRFDAHEHYLWRAIRDQQAWEEWEDMSDEERAAREDAHRARWEGVVAHYPRSESKPPVRITRDQTSDEVRDLDQP
jgi:hypothetical protein